MPDDMTTPMPEEGGTASAAGLKGFLATKAGKAIAAGALVGLLALVGVVVALVALSGDDKANEVVVTPVVPASQASTSTAPDESKETTSIPPAVPDSEVFTFRDIFRPLILKKVENPPALPGSTVTSSTAGEPDTLYLQDVISEDGKDKAVLTYNGTVYTLAEGEIVTGTPWKVLSIDSSSDSVVMLYGDSQITLTVGQGTASGK